MPKEIKIIITPEAEVTIETSGFKGKSCLEVTKAFEQALGVTGNKSFKPEYYQKEEKRISNNN